MLVSSRPSCSFAGCVYSQGGGIPYPTCRCDRRGPALEQAASLQAKRAASEPSGPAEKRKRIGEDLGGMLGPGFNPLGSGGLGLGPTSCGTSDDFFGEASVFLSAPATGSAEPMSLLARSQHGRLFALGLRRVQERLAALQGSGPVDASVAVQMRRVLCFYHSVICRPAHPQMSQHTAREMETLSELIDALLEGDLDRCGDIAMQRYKALEMSLADNSWEVA